MSSICAKEQMEPPDGISCPANKQACIHLAMLHCTEHRRERHDAGRQPVLSPTLLSIVYRKTIYRLSPTQLPIHLPKLSPCPLNHARLSENTSTPISHDLLAYCIVYATRRVEMASLVIVSTSDNVLMDGLI